MLKRGKRVVRSSVVREMSWNAKSGFANQPEDFFDPHLAGVAHFLGGARNVAGVVDSEDERVKDRPVGAIERTVDENVLVVGRRGRHPRAINRRDVLASWSSAASEAYRWRAWTSPGGHRAARSSG